MATKLELMKSVRDDLLVGSIDGVEFPLFQERKKNGVFPVVGEGSHDAGLMFIGEAPGKNEAATGRPFCGASGRILDNVMAHIGLDRKTAYVTNLVKDRPTNNRDPLPEEIAAYAPLLDRQVAAIEPTVIATLGRFSMAYVMEKCGLLDELLPISKLHGKVFESKTPYAKFVVPLYHPAVAAYSPSMIEVLKKDAETLKALLGE
jgi:uracil-DNA glycosylase family 4